MTKVLERGTIELARIETLNALDAAKERLDEASLAAALPGGDDKAMLEAEQECARLRQKLQGLAHGMKQVEAADKERKDAEDLVNRRERAVEMLSLIHQRAWATQALDEALENVAGQLREIERLGGLISYGTSGMTEADRNLFLINLDCYGMADTGYRYTNRTQRLAADYSAGLAFTRPVALRAAAKTIPEILHEDVEEEAVARARKEAGTDG